MSSVQGSVVLQGIPDEDCEKRIRDFLARYSKNTSPDRISDLIKKTPLVLARNIPASVGNSFADNLIRLGASARFVPNESNGPAPFGSPHVEEDIKHFTGNRKDLHQGLASESRESDREKYEQSLIERVSAEDSAGPGESYPELPKSSKETAGTGYLFHAGNKGELRYRLADKIAEVNKELWIIFSMVAVAGLMNYLVASQYMILGLYSFPTIMSAYFYGRRHAVMTAVLTIILVGILLQFNTEIFGNSQKMSMTSGKWYHMMAWGSVLICTAYAMGTLYERHLQKVRELRKTYQGLIVILRHFISKDQYTENHCYRVSLYAAKIAFQLGLDDEQIEDIRSAGLLHDIGKLKISRELLYKAAKLSEKEYQEIKNHVKSGAEILEPLKGPLGRIIPIILAHHDRFDGNGYRPNRGEEIPLGARILAVADVYDALTSDRPYRKAMAPTEAKDIIVKGSGRDFDPQVVNGFLKAFQRGEMDVPNLIV